MNLSMDSKNTNFESSIPTLLSHKVFRFCSQVLIIMKSNSLCQQINISSGRADRVLEDIVVCMTRMSRVTLLLDWVLDVPVSLQVNGHVGKELYKDLVEMVPLVQSLMVCSRQILSISPYDPNLKFSQSVVFGLDVFLIHICAMSIKQWPQILQWWKPSYLFSLIINRNAA